MHLHPNSPARPRPAIAAPLRLLVATWALVATSGCVVNIEDKKGGGVDPCDPNPCETNGVCTGWTATCTVTKGAAVCSNWKPKTGTAKEPEAYEADETLCDGVDNDCDGQTDEALAAPADACTGKGLCASAAIPSACIGGQWSCDLAAIPGYQVTETTCDGIDNDCDGSTDEGLVATLVDCPRGGVCAGLPAPTCDNGAWQCHTDKAADYEPSETSCDGKDNDCDGYVDVNLKPSALQGGASCPNVGVCAGKAAIACIGGKAACATDGIANFEQYESLCDGLDNDCDGKTDNVQGTDAPLWNADIASCSKDGVCKTALAGAINRRCKAGTWTCDYSAVGGYEAKETLCDGKDNDCDGKVDEELPAPPVSPCGNKGVCAAVAPTCAGAVWTCDAAALTAGGFEPTEVSCDGKDNDCDGSTDETAGAAANGCMTKGVCAVGVSVTCSGGKPTCDYGTVAHYQAATETMCDGKDNDCDGVTDEAESLDVSKSGCSVGVCAGKATATCSSGAWACVVDGVGGYEKVEQTCDGKDNDCDGVTDEDLGAKAAASCKTVGVCAAGVVAACVAGQSVCAYQSPDWQGAETLCDGKDNDCDGLTDTGLCGAMQSCGDDTACKAGGCATVLGTTAKVCTASTGQCARLDSAGKTELVDGGTTVCADDAATLSCVGGSFGTPTKCPSEKPACEGGVCKLCISGKSRCDPNDKAGILVCAADGSAETKGTPCASGRCAGYGVCVVDGVIDVSTSVNDDNRIPAAAPLGDGFVVAWFAAQSFSDTLRLRIHDATGKGGGLITAQANVAPNSTSKIRVAQVGTGFAVAWHGVGSTPKTYVRHFAADGTPTAAEAAVATGTGGAQTNAAVAGNSNGGVIVWSEGGGNTATIVAQRLGKTGALAASTIVVSAAAGSNQTGAGGSNTAPAVAMLPSGGFVVAWQRTGGNDGNDGLYWRRVGADDKLGTQARISATGKVATEAAVALNAAGDALVVWREVVGSDTGDIVGVRLDSSDKVSWGPSTVNATTTGVQSLPSVTAGVGRFAITWSSIVADGGDVLGRDLLDSGTFSAASDAAQVTPATGLQSESATVGYADGRVVLVWRQRDAASAKGAIKAQFR